jgi:uncharacterized iron-regulated protein
MKEQGASRRRGSSRPPIHTARRASFWAAVAAVTFGAAAGTLLVSHSDAAPSPAGTARACETQSSWIDTKTGRVLDRNELFRDLSAKKSVVLLGESHTDRDHHSWQLQTLAAIYGRGENLVIGFESFPRRLQGVLDDWIAGKLSDEAFLKASEWRTVWGYDASLYMPLFQFARINHIPMVALNVDRSLVARVGQEGWEGVPKSEREGLSDPAPAGPNYQRELARVYAMKKLLPPGTDPLTASRGEAPPEPDEAALAEAMKEPQFKRFVEAQLTWDRGMAEALANAKRKYPDATVVGIVGSGHVEEGYGIPHQLENLGAGYTTLIPVSADSACKLIGTSFADAIFTLPPAQETAPPERPRLGVLLAQGDGAPRIKQVVAGSVAEATGLRADDDIVRAAGLEMRKPDDLVEVVGRQAPGTWLPLSIRRDGQESELIAKFPPRPRPE